MDETDEILADTEFAEALRKSIKQADAGNTIPWDEIRDEILSGQTKSFSNVEEMLTSLKEPWENQCDT